MHVTPARAGGRSGAEARGSRGCAGSVLVVQSSGALHRHAWRAPVHTTVHSKATLRGLNLYLLQGFSRGVFLRSVFACVD